MEASDPKYVGLALDTGHFHLAGGDVVKALDQHGSRLNPVPGPLCRGLWQLLDPQSD